MNSTRNRIIAFAGILLAICSFGWSLYRDIHIEQTYPGDLRNRVVGSRMQLDGRSPYFYHWKAEDGDRYFDWSNYQTRLKISNVTATPFFHELMWPIVDLSQYRISKIWLALQYAAMLMMVLVAWQFTRNRIQRIAVIATALLFMQCYAWTAHIYQGQIYLFNALVAMLFYYFITRRPTILHGAFAGLFAVSLVLMRPNAFLIILPFIFLLVKMSPKYLSAFFGTILLVLFAEFATKENRSYWNDYSMAVSEHVKLHQGLGPIPQVNQSIVHKEEVEGWSDSAIVKAEQWKGYTYNGEHGNVFVFINRIFKTHLPLWAITGLYLVFALVMVLLFYRVNGPPAFFSPWSLAILGACLYMASDLGSPIHRYHYNASQWIYPLLLVAAGYQASFRKQFIAGILLGLVLNCAAWSVFPMQHSIGEYTILVSILCILFTYKKPVNG